MENCVSKRSCSINQAYCTEAITGMVLGTLEGFVTALGLICLPGLK